MIAGGPRWLVDSRNLLPTDQDEPDPVYRAALDWIWSFSARRHLTREEQRQDRDRKLPRTRALLASLGNPHQQYPAVVVAGTKGKGSTVAFLDAMLMAAGRRTGRYTSPHLLNWRERTCVSGIPIHADEVCALVERLRWAVGRLDPALGVPSTFEIGTVLSLAHFLDRQVDLAIVEVGVGGAHDATNAVDSLVAGIVSVSYEHVATLGPDLASIAREKSGVLRGGRAAVIGPVPPEAEEVICATALERGSRLVRIGHDWRVHQTQVQPPVVEMVGSSGEPRRLELGLLGRHQAVNAAIAVAMLDELGRVRPDLAASEAAVAAGARHVVWPGRLQVIARGPTVLLDGAHNGASAAALRQALDDLYPGQDVHVLFGTSEDKDARAMLSHLAPRARSFVLTQSRHERARAPGSLLEELRSLSPSTPAEVAPDAARGLERVLTATGRSGVALVTGSLFLVADVLSQVAALATHRRSGVAR